MKTMNLAAVYNAKYANFNITARAIQYKNVTVGFDGDDAVIPTLEEGKKAEEVIAVRGTAFLGGYLKNDKNGPYMFFMKPNPGSRATDILGLRGP